MSIFVDCRATLFIADHAADDRGKISALGLGWRVAGLTPEGLTPPMSVVALIDVPAKYIGHEFPVSLELRRADTDEIVKVPSSSGQPDSLRVQQVLKAEPNNVPGAHIPSTFGSRVQVVMTFATGIPVQQGVTYNWKLEIEGQHRKGWEAEFYIIGPPPAPVFGGPADRPQEELPPLKEYTVDKPEQPPATDGS